MKIKRRYGEDAFDSGRNVASGEFHNGWAVVSNRPSEEEMERPVNSTKDQKLLLVGKKRKLIRKKNGRS